MAAARRPPGFEETLPGMVADHAPGPRERITDGEFAIHRPDDVTQHPAAAHNCAWAAASWVENQCTAPARRPAGGRCPSRRDDSRKAPVRNGAARPTAPADRAARHGPVRRVIHTTRQARRGATGCTRKSHNLTFASAPRPSSSSAPFSLIRQVMQMKATALALGVVGMAAGPFIGVSAAQAAPAPHVVTVSQHGHGRSGNRYGGTAFTSISAAVAAVAPGGRVIVDGGTYHEDVTVTKSLTLEGTGHATIDASNLTNGVEVTADHVTVTGLRVQHATGEGILLENAEQVTVEHNTVTDNDLGVALTNPVKNSYAFCQPQGGAANDCGENIHLVGSSHNTVRDNLVTDGSGGILLSDETGPTSHNTIADNTVLNNLTACGVVMAGHNGKAAPGGTPAPTVAGVFDNLVTGNVISGNGLKSTGGAGVQMATGVPGGAVYSNTVTYNRITGNGHSGITMHSHTPGQDLNGAVVEGNIIGTNNVNGDNNFATKDDQTTGVFVGSVTPLSITVKNNVIENDKVGVFTSGPVTVTGQQRNAFHNVTTPVSNNA